jgi:hypothetical protein
MTVTFNGSKTLDIQVSQIPIVSSSLELMFAQYVVAKLEQLISLPNNFNFDEELVKTQKHINDKIARVKSIYT